MADDTPNRSERQRTIPEHMVAIQEALEKGGHSRADLGRLLSLDSPQVWRLFNSKRRLQLHEAAKVSQWLGIKIDGAAIAGDQPATVTPLPGLVPLLGWTGASSATRRTTAEQVQLGYVPAHPAQANFKDAFALQVSDVSMVPRYEPGEIVYVAPNHWPKRGQDCVIVTSSNESLLKRYEGRTLDGITLHQFNPDEDLQILTLDLEAIHAVVGRG